MIPADPQPVPDKSFIKVQNVKLTDDGRSVTAEIVLLRRLADQLEQGAAATDPRPAQPAPLKPVARRSATSSAVPDARETEAEKIYFYDRKKEG